MNAEQVAAGAPVPRVRSALFVPGGRRDFLAKAADRGADAIIFDLEDAVADGRKGEARDMVGRWIADRRAGGAPALCVRVNPEHLADDLAAIVHPNLLAVVLPKVNSVDDLRRCIEALSWAEGRAGVPHGDTRVWPLVETAAAVRIAHELATASPRIAFMGGGSSPDGDLARALGFQWSAEGTETLFVRSKVLVDVRAAGVPNPVTGLVAAVSSTEEVRTFATEARRLGYEGMMVIHPSHVPIANAAFGASEADVTEALELLAALDDAERAGLGAVAFRGRMIDVAMARTAGDLLRSVGITDRTGPA